MSDARTSTTRDRIIDALMALAAERGFEEITITDIARRAEVSLADFRDAFPSKGAVLGGFNRRIDRAVLEGASDALDGEPAKERLFDVLMRRLDAMAPYKESIAEILRWARREPLDAAALNREALNSMRFMLEAADIHVEGAAGALKLQGLAMAFGRVLETWIHDHEEGQSATMAALDRELARGASLVARLDDLDRLSAPARNILRAMFNAPRAFGARVRERAEQRREAETT